MNLERFEKCWRKVFCHSEKHALFDLILYDRVNILLHFYISNHGFVWFTFQSQKPNKWKIPTSWSLLFGSGFPPALFWDTHILFLLFLAHNYLLRNEFFTGVTSGSEEDEFLCPKLRILTDTSCFLTMCYIEFTWSGHKTLEHLSQFPLLHYDMYTTQTCTSGILFSGIAAFECFFFFSPIKGSYKNLVWINVRRLRLWLCYSLWTLPCLLNWKWLARCHTVFLAVPPLWNLIPSCNMLQQLT